MSDIPASCKAVVYCTSQVDANIAKSYWENLSQYQTKGDFEDGCFLSYYCTGKLSVGSKEFNFICVENHSDFDRFKRNTILEEVHIRYIITDLLDQIKFGFEKNLLSPTEDPQNKQIDLAVVDKSSKDTSKTEQTKRFKFASPSCSTVSLKSVGLLLLSLILDDEHSDNKSISSIIAQLESNTAEKPRVHWEAGWEVVVQLVVPFQNHISWNDLFGHELFQERGSEMKWKARPIKGSIHHAAESDSSENTNQQIPIISEIVYATWFEPKLNLLFKTTMMNSSVTGSLGSHGGSVDQRQASFEAQTHDAFQQEGIINAHHVSPNVGAATVSIERSHHEIEEESAITSKHRIYPWLLQSAGICLFNYYLKQQAPEYLSISHRLLRISDLNSSRLLKTGFYTELPQRTELELIQRTTQSAMERVGPLLESTDSTRMHMKSSLATVSRQVQDHIKELGVLKTNELVIAAALALIYAERFKTMILGVTKTEIEAYTKLLTKHNKEQLSRMYTHLIEDTETPKVFADN